LTRTLTGRTGLRCGAALGISRRRRCAHADHERLRLGCAASIAEPSGDPGTVWREAARSASL